METGATRQLTELAEKASQLTTDPGVYLMKDGQGSVVYVGKAKSLRSRVRSYFQRTQDAAVKTQLMVSKVHDIETIVTPTEKDALILENILIKKYRPRYNVVFRDDKEYPYLRLAAAEAYPNLTIVRRPRRDGSLYFGPFASVQAVRETLKAIHKIFPLRKCAGKRLEKDRPCIYHQLGQCPAPCSRPVDPGSYQRAVNDVRLFLLGRGTEVVKRLRGQMEQEAEKLNFEEAARMRDRIGSIEKTLEKQTQVCRDATDRDIFACCGNGERMAVSMLFVRNGRMMGSRSHSIQNRRLPDAEALTSFIAQYYDGGEYIPHEIIVPVGLDGQDVLAEWLKEKKGSTVTIVFPRRGTRRTLLAMAAQNAAAAFSRFENRAEHTGAVLRELQIRLRLSAPPRRIACFDISNIMGTSAVGAMVLFEEGKPLKEGYRKFRIQTVEGPDDYAMIDEVLRRYLEGAKKESALPDLIVVDGGKGQLAVLCEALQALGIESAGAAALAKGRRGDGNSRKEADKVFLPLRKNPVSFPRQSPALLLLQRIRDEAHRFAVSYHSALKKKKDFTSALEGVSGVGAKTVKAALRHFGSIEGLRKATREELLSAHCLTEHQAKALYEFFHPA